MAEQLVISGHLRLRRDVRRNGNILSSYSTLAGLAVTLPPTTNLPIG